MTTRSCDRCVFAEWEMTAHDPPRINRNRNGRCTYRVQITVYPAPMARQIEDLELEDCRPKAISYTRPYTDCLAFEEK